MIVYILGAAAIFALDFFIKRNVDRTRKLDEEENICGRKIILTKYYNKGAALNFLAQFPKAMLAIHSTMLAAVTVIYGLVLRMKSDTGLKVALTMIVGGGLSNLHDRLTKHHVVDYFRFNVKWKKLRNIIFNISDLFIFLGGALIVIFSIRSEK